MGLILVPNGYRLFYLHICQPGQALNTPVQLTKPLPEYLNQGSMVQIASRNLKKVNPVIQLA
jgi:hypothetical protein